MPLSAGTQLGAYEILDLLGAGGMGEVYRARDLTLKREVAIKVLPSFVSREPRRLERFEQEAQATAALNHPNILAVHQFGSYEGSPYLVCELLLGETLRETMNRGPLPVRKVIDIGVQIARGLAAAHEKGIVHRDLKPENFFITREGLVKILDFGLAKLTQRQTGSGGSGIGPMEQTHPGELMGTAAYMSPEQVRGKDVDARTDIFAFGGILYEMLTGRRAFQGPTWAETMSAILKDDPGGFPIAPATPAGLQRVVLRCLEKSPEQRFQSAADLGFALENFSESGHAPARGTGDRAPSRSAGLRLWAGWAVAMLLLAAIGFLVGRRTAGPGLRVADYFQITHDGRPKSLAGTDGSRLYFNLDPAVPPAEISIAGGETVPIQVPIPSAVLKGVSPDGSRLLVASESIGQTTGFPLWSVGTLGGAPRKLADSVTSAAWSPDGTSVAYTSGKGDLYRVKSNGADAVRVGSIGGRTDWLAWSPDGDTLRFATGDRLGEISSSGSNLHELLPRWKASSSPCCGSWSADSRFFYFIDAGQIWAIDERAGVFGKRAAPVQLTSGPVAWAALVAGKGGKRIFANGLSRRGELARFDLQSGEFRPYLGGISADMLSYSKDSMYVAFTSYPDGSLWKADRDGRNPVQLAEASLHPVLPAWSPDGTQIAFVGLSPKDKQFQVYVVSPDGGDPQRLMPEDHGPETDPGWSADGSKLVFSTSPLGGRDAQSVLRIFDLASHETTTLPGSEGKFSPRWSPDGRFLAASSFDQSSMALFDLKTQQWNPLHQGIVAFPQWSADSRFLYYLTYVGEPGIFRMRVPDGQVERVVDMKNVQYTGTLGSWMGLDPGGAPLLLLDAGTNDIYALTPTEE